MAESDTSISRRSFVQLSVTGAAIAGAAGIAAWKLTQRPRAEASPATVGEALEAELVKLATVDPALLHYRRQSVLAVDLRGAVDMAITPTSIVAAVGRSVHRLTPDGKAQDVIDLPDEATCVCAAGTDLLVGFMNHIAVYDEGGAEKAAWPALSGRPRLASMAWHAGETAVGDAGNRTVWRLNASGRVIGRIESRFIIPSPYFDVRYDDDGVLWVANIGKHRLEAYRPDGTLLRTWGAPAGSMGAGTGGFTGCCNPCHYTLMPGGRFITSEKGLNRIAAYLPDGQFDCFVADHQGLGVAVARIGCDMHDAANAPPLVAPAPGRADHVLVLCPSTGELLAFEPTA